MTLEDDIRALSAVTLFGELSMEQLRLLAFGAERVQLAAGQTLYVQNDPAECGYVIVTGEIALNRRVGGQDMELDVARPGDVLGQAALITETTRMTAAVAKAPSEALRISRSIFRRMLTEYPDTAHAIHQRMSADLTQLLRDILALERQFGKTADL